MAIKITNRIHRALHIGLSLNSSNLQSAFAKINRARLKAKVGAFRDFLPVASLDGGIGYSLKYVVVSTSGNKQGNQQYFLHRTHPPLGLVRIVSHNNINLSLREKKNG